MKVRENAQLFARQLGNGCEAEPAAGPELERRLEELLQAAGRAWPTLRLDEEAFLLYLAEVTKGQLPPTAQHAGSLYLACACANGDERALALFRDHHIPSVHAALQRIDAATVADEVLQEMMEKLFVRGGQHGAGIRNYAGRGSLNKWLQVMAVRTAYRLLRRQRGRERIEAPSRGAELVEQAAAPADPLLIALKQRYRGAFKQAFERAFEALSSRDRTVLRYRYLDGLNIDQIGRILGVSRATSGRWQLKARERLFAETRALLERELQLDADEFQSVVRLIRSQLDVSLMRLFRRDGASSADS